MAEYRETRSLEDDKQEQELRREDAQKERRQTQLRRMARIAAALALMAAAVVTGWWVMGPVRLSNLTDALGLIGKRGGGYPLDCSYGNLRQAALLGNSIALLEPTQLLVYSKNGYQSLDFGQPYASPALRTAYGRAVLFDRATGKLTLLGKTGMLYNKELARSLFCVDLGKSGDLAAAIRAESAASEIYVWDAADKQQFAWRCEKEYPSALRLGGRGLGACLIGTEQAGVYARFVEFSFDKAEPRIDARIDDAWLYGAAAVTNGWLAVGDRALYHITRDNQAEALSYGGRALDSFDMEQGGYCALVLEDWENRALLRVYSTKNNGKADLLALEQGLPQRPLGVFCNGGYVYLRFEDSIVRWRKGAGFRQSQPLPQSTQEAFVAGNTAYLLTLRHVEQMKLRWGACEMLGETKD